MKLKYGIKIIAMNLGILIGYFLFFNVIMILTSPSPGLLITGMLVSGFHVLVNLANALKIFLHEDKPSAVPYLLSAVAVLGAGFFVDRTCDSH